MNPVPATIFLDSLGDAVLATDAGPRGAAWRAATERRTESRAA